MAYPTKIGKPAGFPRKKKKRSIKGVKGALR